MVCYVEIKQTCNNSKYFLILENLINKSYINLWTDINSLIKVYLQRQDLTSNSFFILPYKWLLQNIMSKKMHIKRKCRKKIFTASLCKKKIIKNKRDILNVDHKPRLDLKPHLRKVQRWLLLIQRLKQILTIIKFSSVRVMKLLKEIVCAEKRIS